MIASAIRASVLFAMVTNKRVQTAGIDPNVDERPDRENVFITDISLVGTVENRSNRSDFKRA
jgi:hypothetical protein